MTAADFSPLQTHVPADRRAAVDTLLARRSVRSAQPLTGGASGAIMLRLQLGAEVCVLRIDGPADGFRDPARQYACQAIAAAGGVAPALLAGDPVGRVSLSAFVPPGVEPPRPAKLAQIARAVRRLHDGPVFPPLVAFMDGMTAVLGHFTAATLVPAAVSNEASALLARIQAAYRPDPADVVASHNDLNPGNILFGPQGVVSVDWESAFAADRFADIGAILNYFAADGAADAAMMLTAYFGRPPTPRETARAEAMRQGNRLFYGALLLMAAAQQGGQATAADLAAGGYEALRAGPIEAASARGKIALGCAVLNDAFKAGRAPAFAATLAAL